MNVTTQQITDDRRLQLVTTPADLSSWLTDDTHRWIDLHWFDTEQLEHFLTPLDLPATVREACRSAPTRPLVISLEDVLFISVPVDIRDKMLRYLSILVAPTTVITIQYGTATSLQDVGADQSNIRRLVAAYTAGMLHWLLVAVLKETVNDYYRIRTRTIDMARTLDRDPTTIDAGDILDLKRTVTPLGVLFEDQMTCVLELHQSRSETLRLKTIHAEVTELLQDLQRGMTIIARLEDRVRDLYQFHLQTLEETTNRRLKVLTVLSAIYLPSTLIAGIYGMNFQYIPVLGMRFGYAMALTLMIGLVIGQLWFFHRRGWFR
ncbi:MAG: CorA family divalent cation transporter [Phycisphaerales bacterium]